MNTYSVKIDFITFFIKQIRISGLKLVLYRLNNDSLLMLNMTNTVFKADHKD